MRGKQSLIILVIILIAIVFISIGLLISIKFKNKQPTTSNTSLSRSSAFQSITVSPLPFQISTFSTRPKAEVLRVIDGDTIELTDKSRVRYIGVNAPESVDPRKQVECFGREAADFNKQLVAGQTVELEKDVSDKDKYGRFLRYVYLDDVFINDFLVRQGYAQVETVPPDVKFAGQFLSAQKEAREAKRGLWGKCRN